MSPLGFNTIRLEPTSRRSSWVARSVTRAAETVNPPDLQRRVLAHGQGEGAAHADGVGHLDHDAVRAADLHDMSRRASSSGWLSIG